MNIKLNLEGEKIDIDYNRFLEKMYGEVMILSPSFKILDVNESFIENNNLKSVNEAIGKYCYEIKSESSICASRDEICPGKEVLNFEEPKSITNHYLNKNNEDRYNRIRLMPLFNKEGNLECIIHGKKDITSTEIKKQRNNEIFKHFMDISVPTYISSLEGRFLIANPATIQLLGYDDLEDLQNVDINSMYSKPKNRNKLIEELKEKGYVKNSEQRFQKKNGTYLNVNLNLVLDQDKIKGVLYDIGENIIPICQHCENIRIGSQKNSKWVSPIEYMKEEGFNLSHGICESCLNEKYKLKPK